MNLGKFLAACGGLARKSLGLGLRSLAPASAGFVGDRPDSGNQLSKLRSCGHIPFLSRFSPHYIPILSIILDFFGS